MENIASIIASKKIKKTGGRPVNPRFEVAREFAEYVDLPVAFVLRLFRDHGEGRVLGLRSWLKDINNRRGGSLCGLALWKLRQEEKQ